MSRPSAKVILVTKDIAGYTCCVSAVGYWFGTPVVSCNPLGFPRVPIQVLYAMLWSGHHSMLDMHGNFGARSGCPTCSAGFTGIFVWHPGSLIYFSNS